MYKSDSSVASDNTGYYARLCSIRFAHDQWTDTSTRRIAYHTDNKHYLGCGKILAHALVRQNAGVVDVRFRLGGDVLAENDAVLDTYSFPNVVKLMPLLRG
jgi:hypothetical protein